MPEIIARRQIIEAIKETTYGDFLDPTGNVMWAENLKVTPLNTESEKEVDICGKVGSEAVDHYNPHVLIEFDFYYRGVNTPGDLPHESAVFLAGSRALTQTATEVTMTTLDEGVDSMSIRYHQDGDRYRASGVRGVITSKGDRDKRLMFTFKGMGLRETEETGIFPDSACDALASYPAIRMNSSTTCTYNALTPKMINFSTAYGADARYENNVNDAEEIVVDDRAMTAKVSFRSLGIGAANWNAERLAGTKFPVSWQFGTEAGKIITQVWPSCQIANNDPTGTDGNKRTDAHDLLLLPDATGNDEIIVFK